MYPGRAWSAEGEVIEGTGYVESTDLSKPGELTLHLDGIPDVFAAPYWIVALGNEHGVSFVLQFIKSHHTCHPVAPRLRGLSG